MPVAIYEDQSQAWGGINMTSPPPDDTARQAQLLYDRLKHSLEPAQAGKFVAIEPVSGDYFLGETLSEAIGAARRTHPGRLVHGLRVGHPAAVHLGAFLR
jgi:hypothetical protein